MIQEIETVIRPGNNRRIPNIREIYQYRDLLVLLIRRDFVARYKQTILGPAWAIIQPLMTSVVFTIVFGRVAKMPTDGAPPFLFYLAGMLFWQLFSNSLNSGANSLQQNANIFSKVYFPRIIPSLALQISQLIPFTIQFFIFCGFCGWYYLMSPIDFAWVRLLIFPLLLVQVSLLSLGVSLLCSSLTAKYRDLQHAMGFLVQLGLYVSPVIYPASFIGDQWRWLIWLNPIAAPITTSKWVFLGAGEFPLLPLLLSASMTLLIFIYALSLFQRTQRSYIDTV